MSECYSMTITRQNRIYNIQDCRDKFTDYGSLYVLDSNLYLKKLSNKSFYLFFNNNIICTMKLGNSGESIYTYYNTDRYNIHKYQRAVELTGLRIRVININSYSDYKSNKNIYLVRKKPNNTNFTVNDNEITEDSWHILSEAMSFRDKNLIDNRSFDSENINYISFYNEMRNYLLNNYVLNSASKLNYNFSCENAINEHYTLVLFIYNKVTSRPMFFYLRKHSIDKDIYKLSGVESYEAECAKVKVKDKNFIDTLIYNSGINIDNNTKLPSETLILKAINFSFKYSMTDIIKLFEDKKGVHKNEY